MFRSEDLLHFKQQQLQAARAVREHYVDSSNADPDPADTTSFDSMNGSVPLSVTDTPDGNEDNGPGESPVLMGSPVDTPTRTATRTVPSTQGFAFFR